MDPTLARLSDAFFAARNTANPFGATTYGFHDYDDQVPDPGREASGRHADGLRDLETELSEIDVDGLDDTDRVTHAVLADWLRNLQGTERAGLSEVGVTASFAGPLSGMITALPATVVVDGTGAEAYLTRLTKLGGYFDALVARYRQAAGDGRHATALGVRQAIDQVDGYLARSVQQDPLLKPQPPDGVDAAAWRERAAAIIAEQVRPALSRYRTALADDLLPAGRDDAHVGVCHVPGGTVGYLAEVRKHTTTDLTPEELHRTGLNLVAELREEFAERGAAALGTSDVDEVLRRLREDESLRFESAEQIVDAVTSALRAAEAALPDWFRDYDIVPCEVGEIDPVQAKDAVLGYYMPPATDGSRPGRHMVNTYRPEIRPRYEYEALAFHESVPGHHLQFAAAQGMADLPDFRRNFYIAAHGEGWALYTERLCDEMGLYTSELTKLGMVSYDAWRACRLVVDTGMHLHGWSRQRAIDYMRANTALSDSNIANEVDRYIAWPGQALAYMVGKLRILELRDRARAAMGDAFDIADFHDQVLGRGPLPLGVMTRLVTEWSETSIQ